jgi:NADH-quinone oxidoreductase subunit H
MYAALIDWGQNNGIPIWLIDVGFIAGLALVLVLFIALTVMILVYMERKVSADIQMRYGPIRVGWHGSLQLVADMLKLMTKEDVIPRGADKIIFVIAPLAVFVPAFLAYLVIPFGPNLVARDLNVGLLYFMAVPGLSVIGMIMAGWGSNSKYSVIGGMRSAAQIISYEAPRTLSVLGVIMLAGTLSTVSIINAQAKLWFVLLQPLGFIIYFIASIAEVNRVPFDLPEAESELVAGFHTEYSGLRFAFFLFAEYAAMFAACAMAVVLFFGGWKGLVPETSVVPPFIWFLIKTYILVYIMMWIRWTLPRYRIDQVMDLGWKILLPLSILNIVVTGGVVLVFGG